MDSRYRGTIPLLAVLLILINGCADDQGAAPAGYQDVEAQEVPAAQPYQDVTEELELAAPSGARFQRREPGVLIGT